MSAQTLYLIGLALVLLYLTMGLDDFIWDIFSLFNAARHKKKKLDLNEVSSVPQKLLAVMIAAWNEENVLEDVVDNLIASTIYPRSMYHLFLGVYPNNTATVEAARRLEAKYDNVHVVVNCIPGPTSKAQNINHVIREIGKFEKERNWRFASFTVHDSEDVVHPYELKVTNYLIDQYPALQFPVFPIIYKPTFRNFFKTITTGTYADEFAENHFLAMRGRDRIRAFVPSAGTGFALSRQVVESFNGEDILENGSLTEDYKLSLTLYQRNFNLHYVLERVPRVVEGQRIVWDYIATRSIFPNTFKTAVRQKTRWITGITMQSIRFFDIFKLKDMSFVGKYSLYKDQKAKLGNLLSFVGYPVFIYFIASWFVELTPIYPRYTLSWYLSLVVTVEMLERQLFRAVAIYNIYGMRSVFFACLFPPLLPIRIVWGNVINFVATVKAYRRKYLGAPRQKKKDAIPQSKKTIKWDKTDHSFLAIPVLRRYHRKLGDILLEKRILTPEELKHALEEKEKVGSNQSLGSYLVENGSITEDQLLVCLADIFNRVYLHTSDFREYPLKQFAGWMEDENIQTYNLLPFLQIGDTVIVASSVCTVPGVEKILEEKYKVKIQLCLATQAAIQAGQKQLDTPEISTIVTPAFNMLEYGKISWEQFLLVENLVHQCNLTENQALDALGIAVRETAPRHLCDSSETLNAC